MEKFIKFITNEKFYLPIVYIVVGLILYLVIEKVINRISKGHIGNSGKDKRKDTIINLGRSIFKYLILIFIVLGILKIYGIDTTSIIASLGVFAAVIGLAFQDIIKDLLAGVAILFDNKYAVRMIHYICSPHSALTGIYCHNRAFSCLSHFQFCGSLGNGLVQPSYLALLSFFLHA